MTLYSIVMCIVIMSELLLLWKMNKLLKWCPNISIKNWYWQLLWTKMNLTLKWPSRTGAILAVALFAELFVQVESSYANTPFTSFAFPGTGSPTSRTAPDRISDIYNVKEYGAIGNSITDDTTAIRAAISAMWGSTNKGGTLYFPPGIYLVTDTIDITNYNVGSNDTSGRIIGASRQATFITGNLPNGFIFMQVDGQNGPEEIGHLTLANTSTWIGSGALLVANTLNIDIHDCSFQGMVGVLGIFNMFQSSINRCIGTPNSDVTTGFNGTFGVASYSTDVKNWRSTQPYQAGIQMWGANTAIIESCGIENCGTAILLGKQAGWAPSCTVAPDGSNPGFSILTVGGTLATTLSKQFSNGAKIYGRGLALQTWGADPNDSSGTSITADHNTDGTLTGIGFAGTYRINGTYTISTPIPIVTRIDQNISSISINDTASEACYHHIYIETASGLTINGGGCGSQPGECVDAFGNTGFTPRCGLYLKSAGGSKITGYNAADAATYLGGIVIDPNAVITNVTFDSCTAQKEIDAITGNTSTINNGSGSSGTIFNVNSNTVSGSYIGIGMAVSGTGVTAGTTVTGNYATETQAISSYTYNSGTGLVTLTMAASQTIPSGWAIATSGLKDNLGNDFAGLNITTTATTVSGTTVTYTAATGLVGTPSGGGTLHTLTGLGGAGTYRINNAHNLSARAFTVTSGADWVMPTATASKAGLKFVNCGAANLPAGYVSGLNSLNMTFTSLPKQAGASSNVAIVEGQSFYIIDANTATLGNAVTAGGAPNTRGYVTWNGTNWTLTSK